MNIFGKIGHGITAFWHAITGTKAEKVVGDIEKYVEQAMPIVMMVAAATASTTDDEWVAKLTAIYQKYDVQVEAWLQLSPEDRGQALLNIATKALQKQLPDVQVSTLMSAAQLAYSIFKANHK